MSAVAAIDIGSTSVRLLIADGQSELERRTTITRLADGIDRRGSVDDQRAEATLDTLRSYREMLRAHGVERVRAIATSVLRRARDGEAFLDRVAEVLGVRPGVVSGEEEGRLAFAGATARLGADRGPFVVVDLGGGSCEFTTVEGVFSAEFGAARLTERWVCHDPPQPEELVACLSVVEAHLDDVRRELPEVDEAKTWIGVGGTFCTFGAVDIGLEPYDRQRVNGYALSKDAAEDVYRTLVTESLEERVENPGLPADRAQVIVGGACAVVEIMRFFALDEIIISDDDLLDGLVAGLTQQVGP
ncbi:MAG: exopolyphosphatase / guanosine-5-triphosphate,3-diphosphate pyrophosphatase [Acidimicrobiia bacterium]|jgi:exopolyphosphatase/guanosine-5'-triphosphate,3'-diphosphate pyrophosphatase|nr:exopolyphosphatase / guanosine-5-triphosphate,3-diphosphate pyrophosphatase [Acidimicrobiia bacterium]